MTNKGNVCRDKVGDVYPATISEDLLKLKIRGGGFFQKGHYVLPGGLGRKPRTRTPDDLETFGVTQNTRV